jgi:hypothetical protein
MEWLLFVRMVASAFPRFAQYVRILFKDGIEAGGADRRCVAAAISLNVDLTCVQHSEQQHERSPDSARF